MLDNIHWVSVSVSHNYIINKFLARIAIVSRAAFRDNKVHLPWNTRRRGLSRKPFADHAERYALGTLLDPEKCTRLLRTTDCRDIPSVDHRRAWHSTMRSYRKSGRIPCTLKYNFYLFIYFYTAGIIKLRWQFLSTIPHISAHLIVFSTWFNHATCLLHVIHFNADPWEFMWSSEWTRHIAQRGEAVSLSWGCFRDKTKPVCACRGCRGVRKLVSRKNISKRSNYTYARIPARKPHSHA